MRPKKGSADRRQNLVNIRLTDSESEQFRAQAAARKMELGPYLRFLAMEDGEALARDGRLRRSEGGRWQVLVMGNWENL